MIYNGIKYWGNHQKLALNADTGKMHTINLLGYSARLVFNQTENGMEIHLPDTETGKNAFVLRLKGQLFNYLLCDQKYNLLKQH